MKLSHLLGMCFLVCVLVVPQGAHAFLGVEAAVGVWNQSPSGDLAYKGTALNLENDLKYDSKSKIFGRVKIDLPFIPCIYLMATPMKFDGAATKNVAFTFGDKTFTASAPFTSEVRLDHYDLGLFYGLPFLKAATLGKLNLDLGVDIRYIDFKAEIVQTTTGLRESKESGLPIPMVYLGIQVKPIDSLSLEGELRALAYSSNHYYDLIGRVKYKFLGPAFLSAGYRYEDIALDQNDIVANVKFGGPFLEAGVDF